MAGNGRFQCRGGGNEDTRAIREEQGNANTVNPKITGCSGQAAWV